MEEIKIHTEFIKLDQFLKFTGAISTGGEAKDLILSGLVFVNGEREFRRGRKLYKEDVVLLDTDPRLSFTVMQA